MLNEKTEMTHVVSNVLEKNEKEKDVKESRKQHLEMDNSVCYRPVLSTLNDKSTECIAHELIYFTDQTYSKTLQPYLALGIAIMSPYRDLFVKMMNGFPIVYLYGGAQSGKTTLLSSIVSIFGFDKSFIQSGAVTVNRMWNSINKFSSLPVVYDEVLSAPNTKKYMGELLKSTYDGKTRGRMLSGEKTSDQKVNSTLIFASNNLPLEDDAIRSRLMLLTFDPRDVQSSFIDEFKETRDKYLSLLLPEILKFGEDKIKEYFLEARNKVATVENADISSRERDNFAVALTGIRVLLEIEGHNINLNLDERVEEFIKNYSKDKCLESDFDKFLNAIPTMIKKRVIELGIDYSIDNNSMLRIYFQGVYPLFSKYYRETCAEKAPSKAEIEYSARVDKRVVKDNNQLTKSLKIGSYKKRCLLIDVSKHEDFLYSRPSINIPDKDIDIEDLCN